MRESPCMTLAQWSHWGSVARMHEYHWIHSPCWYFCCHPGVSFLASVWVFWFWGSFLPNQGSHIAFIFMALQFPWIQNSFLNVCFPRPWYFQRLQIHYHVECSDCFLAIRFFRLFAHHLIQTDHFWQEHCIDDTVFSSVSHFRCRRLSCWLCSVWSLGNHLVSASFLPGKGVCFPLCLISHLQDYTSRPWVLCFLAVFHLAVLASIHDSRLSPLLQR